MILIEPEPPSVEEVQFLLVLAHKFAQPHIVEDEPSCLVDCI